MADIKLPENPSSKSLTMQTTPQPSNSSENSVVTPKTLITAIKRLASFYGFTLTVDRLRFSVKALEDLTSEQLTTGFNLIPITHTFFPMPAELREACTGVPARSTASMGASVAANKLWTQAVTWAQRWLEGNRYALTVPGNQPIKYSFTNRSLDVGLSACGIYRDLKTLYRKLDEADVTRSMYERHHFPGAGTKRLALADNLISRHQAAIAVATIELARALEAGDARHGSFLESEIARFNAQMADWEARRIRALARSAADAAAIAGRREELDGAIEDAKARIQAAEDARLFCRLEVEMPPIMSNILKETLLQLKPTISAALQRFPVTGNDDEYLRHNFDVKARQVIAAHAAEQSYLPHSRQLTGGVQSGDLPRVSHGIISVRSNGGATCYSIEELREQQSAGAAISDKDIEAQADFISNTEEIFNAPHSRVPPLPKPVDSSALRHTTHEDDLARSFVIQAQRDARLEAVRAAKKAEYELALRTEGG